jgi:hypothetical protein
LFLVGAQAQGLALCHVVSLLYPFRQAANAIQKRNFG